MRSIVFIPDGNRRYAKRHALQTVLEGHSRGADVARTLIDAAFDEGIEQVVFLGATELNLKERVNEVPHLVRLFQKYLGELLQSPRHDGRVSICGNWKQYCGSPALTAMVNAVEARKVDPGKEGRHLTFLFGHDGARDIADAAQCLAKSGVPVCVDSLKKRLPTAHVGEVDCIFRSGVEGDPHNSGSLMPFQTGNSQFYFTKKLWPEITVDDLRQAIAQVRSRPRRLGK